MAILGFLVHVLAEHAQAAEAAVAAMPAMTTYGTHGGTHIVVVADAPTEELEGLLAEVRGIPGVLNCYVSSLTTDDQAERP